VAGGGKKNGGIELKKGKNTKKELSDGFEKKAFDSKKYGYARKIRQTKEKYFSGKAIGKRPGGKRYNSKAWGIRGGERENIKRIFREDQVKEKKVLEKGEEKNAPPGKASKRGRRKKGKSKKKASTRSKRKTLMTGREGFPIAEKGNQKEGKKEGVEKKGGK